MLERRPLNIVSDFDGAVTDIAKEAAPFIEAYAHVIADCIGITFPQFADALELARAEIMRAPHLHAWAYNGFLVAPAMADPYLTMNAMVDMALCTVGKVVPSDELTKLYFANQKHSAIAFKPDAQTYIQELHRDHSFTFITNSEVATVQRKLALLLGDENGVQVVGNAKKYKIDEAWTGMPENIERAGFPRPVLLRRKAYADILAQRVESHGPIDVVIGDIYELDLALPEQMGIQTVLVSSDLTPAYEKAYYGVHANGFHSPSLADIAARISR